MDRRKELKEQYKQMKSEMGIIYFKCLPTGKIYLKKAINTRGKLNSITFGLKNKSHPNKNLQGDWSEYGEKGFESGVLEVLEYDKDENKTDYSEDLAALLEIVAQQYENKEILL